MYKLNIKNIVIIIIFLLGLYFYSYHGLICKESFLNKNFFNKQPSQCPNILMQKNGKIILKNSKLVEVPGVNPIVFDNLEEYAEFVKWQQSQKLNCDVLYMNHEYDVQGKEIYSIRPNPEYLDPGVNSISCGNIETLDATNIQDTNVDIIRNLPDNSVLYPTLENYDNINNKILSKTNKSLDNLY